MKGKKCKIKWMKVNEVGGGRAINESVLNKNVGGDRIAKWRRGASKRRPAYFYYKIKLVDALY